ncbi:MAG: DsbC family protein [Pseudomonadota bacterium]|nr:DsbC family protein [Pseudomonadota bacterium]
MKLFRLAPALLLFVAAASIAQTDMASIKKAIAEKFPEAGGNIEVAKTAFGWYEVFAGGRLFYTDENVSYFFLGNVVEAKSMSNITAQRLQKLTAIKFESLPLDYAIKTVKGNGKRKVAVFSDPDCPYCKRLEKDLVNVTDVTIYTFLYPIASLHPDAERKSKAVWCSSNRQKAWDDLMLRGVAPAAKNCDTPIEEIQALGQKHKMNGTPTLVFADGRVVPGAIPTSDMESYLNGK